MVFESFDFWAESFWLPANVTWADVERVHGKYQNRVLYQEFIYPWILAVLLKFLSNFLKRKVFLPVGVYFKVNDKIEKAEDNVLLEEAFKKSSSINRKKILSLAKQTDWSEERVSHWWKIRRQESRPSELHRFCECMEEALFYSYNITFAVLILWNKPWMWDNTKLSTDQIPYEVETDMQCYFHICLGHYWFLFYSVIKNYKSNNFPEYFLHHLIAIILQVVGHTNNFHRHGIILMVIHDFGDIYFELARIAKYTGYVKASNSILILFSVVWLITRLCIFPAFIFLWMFKWQSVTCPGYHIITCLLVLMLFLHVFWTIEIAQLIHRTFFVNKVDRRRQSNSEHQTTNSMVKDLSTSNGNLRKME